MRAPAGQQQLPGASGPTWYVLVDADGGEPAPEDRERMTLACDVLLELLRPQVQSLQVDAYSDHDDVMPAKVREVEDWIAARGEARPRSNLGRMGVELDPLDDKDWQRLRVYAAWSINVDIFGNWPLATFHDSGRSVTARLSPAQATTANQRLPASWKMVPLGPILLAQKQQRRRARLDRRAARAARLRDWWRSRIVRR